MSRITLDYAKKIINELKESNLFTDIIVVNNNIWRDIYQLNYKFQINNKFPDNEINIICFLKNTDKTTFLTKRFCNMETDVIDDELKKWRDILQ